MCEDYGVWAEKSMYGRTYFGIVRTTFLIGKPTAIKPASGNKVKVTGHVRRGAEGGRGVGRPHDNFALQHTRSLLTISAISI